jgi:CheY-like chemotaxis protein/signal recognition particle receptor subunit beta
MALFNHATKEVTAKLVYYGPGLCGKTTNLQWIHEHMSFKSKGKLVSLATQADRTLFFDFLPVELGTIRGMRTRMQIYTVPGQVFYEATRRMVLKGCDAVVFVADSQAAMLDANAESQRSLRQNLLVNEIDPSIPQVIQYNKRDTPTALPVSVLNERLNPRNLPYFEAVAFKGIGVEETLKAVTKLLFQWLAHYYGEGAGEAASASADSAAATPAGEAKPAQVMIRVPHATLAASEPAKAPTAATPPPARPSPPPTAPPPVAAPTARPVAPAEPPAEDAAAPTFVFAKQQPKPATPTAPPTRVTPPAAPQPTQRAAPAVKPPAAPAPAVVPAEAPAVAQPPAAAAAPPQRPAAPAPPPSAPPVAPAEPELVEVDAPATTVVFAKSAPPAPPATPPRPVAPAAPLAAPPAPKPVDVPRETAVIKPQPVVIPAAAKAPSAALPPGMTAPAPTAPAKAPAARPGAEEKPLFREPEKPALPSDPPPKGAGLRTEQWLYLLDGTQRGPIDIEDLIDLVLTSIPENTKVWHPGLEGWVLASHVREIADEIPPPVPIPGATRASYGEEDMPDFNTVPSMLRSVLIADEDAAFRKYLAMPLAAQGFTIYEAADGSAAWQLAVQNRPWMILADVSMPEVDGFEFCRRVRSHPMLARLPLLFISGSDKYKERYRALQIGADDFLSKNMPVRELLMRIQLLMTRYSDLSASEAKAGTAEVAGAFQGRIEVFGAPALLQMCAQGRLTGLFTSLAEDAQNTATVMGFREGDIISATVGATTGAEAVYAFLAWEKGSFKFTPGDPGEGAPLAQSVEHLLLEGCRLLDESQKGGPEGGSAFA